jgi:GAF domain-containing protein
MLGAESFPGQVLLSDRSALIENAEKYLGVWAVSRYASPGAQVLALNHQQKEGHISSSVQIRRIASEMAAPVLRTDRKAGVLYVCSTLPNAFGRAQLKLLQECATLITLAFTNEDFYARQDIFLHIMPPPWMQAPLLLQFSQRILQLMRETMNDEVPLDRVRAERIVWQQIEEELIQLASLPPQGEAHET